MNNKTVTLQFSVYVKIFNQIGHFNIMSNVLD